MSDSETDRPLNPRDIMNIFEEVSSELGIETPNFFAAEYVLDKETRMSEHAKVEVHEIESSIEKTESSVEYSDSVPIMSHEIDQPALPWEQSAKGRRVVEVEHPPQSVVQHEKNIASEYVSPRLTAPESTQMTTETDVTTHETIESLLDDSPDRNRRIHFSKTIIVIVALAIVMVLYFLYTSSWLDSILPKSLQFKKSIGIESFHRVHPQSKKYSTAQSSKTLADKYHFFLPVRTLKRKRDAISFLKQYELQGFEGKIRAITAPNRRGFWYDVLLGPYSTRQNAMLMADKFQTIFGFTPTIDSLLNK